MTSSRLKLQFMVSARLEIGLFVTALYTRLRVFGQEHPGQAPHELVKGLRAVDDKLVTIHRKIRESYRMDDQAVEVFLQNLTDDLEAAAQELCVLAERVTQTASLAAEQDIQRVARRTREYIPTILPSEQNHRTNEKSK